MWRDKILTCHSKRQYVYIFGKWNIKKYAVGKFETRSAKDQFEAALAASGSVNNTPNREPNIDAGGHGSGNHPKRMLSTTDGKNDLLEFIARFIVQSVLTGSILVDLEAHIPKGRRLFEFSQNFSEVLRSPAVEFEDSFQILVSFYESNLSTFQQILADEHPHLLGTLFSLWAEAKQYRDPSIACSWLLSSISDQSFRQLGGNHYITKIFSLLQTDPNRHDPKECLDMLAMLPSEIFKDVDYVKRVGSLLAHTQERASSDYHSMATFDGNPGLTRPAWPAVAPSRIKTSSPPYGSDFLIEETEIRSPSPLSVICPSEIAPINLPVLKHETPASEAFQDVNSEPETSEDDSTSSKSTEDSEEQDFLEVRKRQIVDAAMQVFLENLDNWVGNIVGEGHSKEPQDDDGRPAQNASTPSRVGATSRTISTVRPASRKRKRGGREGKESEDEDENEEGERSNKTPREEMPDESLARRFACPYLKNNPRRYRNQTSCCGRNSRGFQTVHRVKYSPIFLSNTYLCYKG